MAQEAPHAAEVLRKLLQEKEKKTKDAAADATTIGATVTSGHPSTQQTPPVDLVLHVADKKSKRKDKGKSRRHASPRLSPNREKNSMADLGTNKGGHLVSHVLASHKGVNI